MILKLQKGKIVKAIGKAGKSVLKKNNSFVKNYMKGVTVDGSKMPKNLSETEIDWLMDDLKTISNAAYNPGKMSSEAQKGIDLMKKAYTSNWMATRLKNMGFSDEQIKDYQLKRIAELGDLTKTGFAENLHSLRNVYSIDNGFIGIDPNPIPGFAMNANGLNTPANYRIIQLTTKGPTKDFVAHEIGGHSTETFDFAHTPSGEEIYSKTTLTPKGHQAGIDNGYGDSYYLAPNEQRARFLVTAQAMADEGFDPNSFEDFLEFSRTHRIYSDATNVGQTTKYYDSRTIWPAFSRAYVAIPLTLGAGLATYDISKNKNGGVIKLQNAARVIPKIVKAAYKAPVVKKLTIPTVPKLVEPLKITQDVTSLRDNIFKEAVKRAGVPVFGSIGKETPLGGQQLLSAMMNGTYVTPPPHTYGDMKLNPNYYYRRGWGLIDDALDTGIIRVPEEGYIKEATKKYPWLDNGNPFSTTLMGQKFPYFSEGSFWPAGGKFGVEPTDLIAIPKGLPWVNWVAGSKWGSLKPYNKPSEFGGRATPLIEGKTNLFPTKYSLLYKLNPETKEYVPYESGKK